VTKRRRTINHVVLAVLVSIAIMAADAVCQVQARKPLVRRNARAAGRTKAYRQWFGIIARKDGPCLYPRETNVIDLAEYDEAVSELRQIIEKSPDEDAVAAAHVSIGNIKRELIGDPAGAIEEYKQAGGFMAGYAADGLAAAYHDLDRDAEAVDAVRALIPGAKGLRTRAMLVITLSEIYEKCGRREKALAVLRNPPETADEENAFSRYVNINAILGKIADMKEAGKEDEAAELIKRVKTGYGFYSLRVKVIRKQPPRVIMNQNRTLPPEKRNTRDRDAGEG